MKKILSILLTVVILYQFGICAFAFQDFVYDMKDIDDYITDGNGVTTIEDNLLPIGAEEKSDSDTVQVQTGSIAYEKLTAEGIADEGKPLSDKITRGEFISMAMRAIGFGDSLRQDGNVFIDVPENHGAAGYIKAAYDLRIISGADGLYEPDRPITYADASVIAVRILGRDAEAKARGGYPQGYMMTANRYGLLTGVDSDGYDTAPPAAELYTLMQNTVESNNFAAVSGYKSSETVYTTDKNSNILSYYLDIYSHMGIAESVGLSNIYGNNLGDTGKITIGGKAFDGDYNEYIPYLGMRVEVLYKKGVHDDTLLYTDYKKYNRCTYISAEDIAGYSNGRYVYYSDNKERTVSVGTDASVLYNGRLVTDENEDVYNPKYGSVMLIDNDRDGSCDVVVIKSTVDIIIGDVDVENEIIYDNQNNKKFSFKSENTTRESWLADTAGKTVYFAMIKKGDILTVRESADKAVIYGVISGDTARGEITAVNNDGKDIYVKIGEKEYKVTAECAEKNKAEIAVGSRRTLKLNAYGYVADIVEYQDTADSMVYAYVIGKAKTSDVFDAKPTLKVLTQNSEIKIYNLRKRCIIDGVSVKNADGQNAALDRGLNIGKVIMLKASEDGEITEIDTAYTDFNAEDTSSTLSKIYSGDDPELRHKLWSFGGTFGEKFFWNKTRTTVFVIHTSESEDKKRYRVETVSYPFENDGNYSPDAYRSTDSFYADVLVAEVGSSGSVSDTTLWAVEDVINIFADDEVQAGLVINSGTEKKTITMDSDIPERYDISAGDIVRCDISGDELIGDSIKKVYDFGDGVMTEEPTGETTVYNVRKCFIYDKKDDLLSLCIADKVEELANPVQANMRIARPTSDVYIISKNSKGMVEVRQAGQADMRTYLSSGKDCTKLLIQYQYQLFKKIFIMDSK